MHQHLSIVLRDTYIIYSSQNVVAGGMKCEALTSNNSFNHVKICKTMYSTLHLNPVEKLTGTSLNIEVEQNNL